MITFQHVMFDSLVILLFVAGIAATLVGVGLIVCSEKMFRLFAVMNRNVSTRKNLKLMSVPRDIGPVVQRYRLLFSAVIIAGSVYSFYSLTAHFSVEAIAGAAALSSVFMVSVIEGLRWFMVVMNAFAFAAGVMLGFFPGALGGIEARANRWYSVRKAVVRADEPLLTLDQWVEAFPHASGLAIMLGALIMTVSTGITLFGCWY